jgi:pimeloyl-ACP methyl ester carboxylesterase
VSSDHWPMPLSHRIFKYAQFAVVPAKRLIVFVHGYRGSARHTWGEFATNPPSDKWWRESDLIFAEYNWYSSSVPSLADDLLRAIEEHFPTVPGGWSTHKGSGPRRNSVAKYSELVLVGHSLGGLVIRYAIATAIQKANPTLKSGIAPVEHPILKATVRLFSPAISGTRIGEKGERTDVPVLASLLHMALAPSVAYKDLKRGSPSVAFARDVTVRLAPSTAGPLLASILWASPDRVVFDTPYITDLVVNHWRDRTHSSVCKPGNDYPVPYQLVRWGEPQ